MQELQNSILQLSVVDRIRLISFIAASISEQAVQMEVPEAWLVEAHTRINKAKEGEAPVFSWEQVKNRIYG